MLRRRSGGDLYAMPAFSSSSSSSRSGASAAAPATDAAFPSFGGRARIHDAVIGDRAGAENGRQPSRDAHGEIRREATARVLDLADIDRGEVAALDLVLGREGIKDDRAPARQMGVNNGGGRRRGRGAVLVVAPLESRLLRGRWRLLVLVVKLIR